MIQTNRDNNFKTSGSIGSGPQFYTKPPSNIPSNQTIEFDDGPKITVFIGKHDFFTSSLDLSQIIFLAGNISDKVPDAMIRKIIAACGPVANWKRVSTFGFCEYE
jgi:RNA-binding protein 25